MRKRPLRISVGSLQPSELSYRAPRERFLLCVPWSCRFFVGAVGAWFRWLSVKNLLGERDIMFLFRCWLVENRWDPFFHHDLLILNVNPIS